MKFAASRPARRRLAVGALALTALVGATGCSAVSPVATAIHYDASDGISKTTEGLVSVRNLALVGAGASGDARLIGTLVNDTDADKTYTFSAENGGEATIDVAAGESVSLEDDANETVIDRGDVWAGETAALTVEADGASATYDVPVLTGTQEEYREYLPDGVDSSDEALTGHLDQETLHYGESEH